MGSVFVACEFSGIVRDAFQQAGHVAMSCDLLDSETPGAHIRGDVLGYLRHSGDRFDLGIAHPPCTYLAASGNRWYYQSPQRIAAWRWTMRLWKAMGEACDRVVLENPVGALSTLWRPPDQYLQPWQYGHAESKKIGFWLKNLPLLVATNLEKPAIIEHRVHRMPPGPTRARERSRFFPGIAAAMVAQWGALLPGGNFYGE